MTGHALYNAELDEMRRQIELLARRRARGEMSSLYPYLYEATEMLCNLAENAPELKPEVSNLVTRCETLMKSIAH
jgi:hypothetical protein